MSLSGETPRENLTLTEADLAACRPIVGEGGHVLRALCPFHGSDRQRSLRVQVHSGRFVCFACGAWGYMATARERWREEQQRQVAMQRPPTRQQRVLPRRQPPPKLPNRPAAVVKQRAAEPSVPRVPAPERAALAEHLVAFQAALPGSRGEAYLQQRGIPLALAQQLGVGYAAPGTWPHAARDWRGGRVVFPHTMPDGRLVNLYGRAVGTAEQVPKVLRHDHLPGTKGYFNAVALHTGESPLWVCEGAFDALALLAAGVPRVVAIFGVQGWCWAWAREIRALVFALDADAAGQQQWQALARQAVLRGKQVAVLPEAAYGGRKDVSEAWAAGVLGLGGAGADGKGTRGPGRWQAHQETWAERVAIMVVDGGLAPVEAARCAWAGTPASGTAGAARSQGEQDTAR
jgi:Toprim domain-containing protein